MTIPSNLKLFEKDIQPSGAYGDIKELAYYCGLNYLECKLNGEWQHGWIPPERNFHPEWVVGSSGESRLHRTKQTYFVARTDQSQFLASCGYTRVRAVGHPIVYARRNEYARRVGSLLVMPSHSTIESSLGLDQSFESYFQYIHSIRSYFDEVYFCVYSTDVDYYSHKLASTGISLIEGSLESDQNSYQRMLSLGSQFEYMTTNYFGSHVAYLSYVGCKVSVAGPKPTIPIDKLKTMQFYRNAPFCIDSASYLGQAIQDSYSFFLVNPWEARPRVEWAQEQLGEQNKLDRIDCLQIISCTSLDKMCGFENAAKLSAKVLLPKSVKWVAKKALSKLNRGKLNRNQLLDFSFTIKTHLTQSELTCLAHFASQLKPNSIGAEIGSYLGASSIATCAGFRSHAIKLFCIDTWMNNAMAYTDDERDNPDLKEQDTLNAFLENTSKCASFILLRRGWSHEVFPSVKEMGIKLDWLFIDGDHSYEGVKTDWDLYSSILSSNAIVIFHDTGWAEGVNQLIIEKVIDCCIIEDTLPNMKVFRYLGKPNWYQADDMTRAESA